MIVTAPAAEVAGLITDAGARGVGAAIVISAGLGHGPGSLAEQARQAARAHGLRLLGLNCLGPFVPSARLNASFDHPGAPPSEHEERGIARNEGGLVNTFLHGA